VVTPSQPSAPAVAANADTSFIKKNAPTLYGIIAIKLGKAALLFLLAFGVAKLADANLPQEFRKLLELVNIDPEHQFFHDLAAKLKSVTPANVWWVATGTLLYGLLSLVEGVGLLFRVSWAGWLVIAEAAFFIPIEVYHLLHGFTWKVFVILLVNVGIIWYLFANRHRLFRHHHHHH
jgi:uncharacterized membrane protein (DUF2068 family)